jgi:hypothetical protein
MFQETSVKNLRICSINSTVVLSDILVNEMKGMVRYQIELFNILFSSVVESKLFIPVPTLEKFRLRSFHLFFIFWLFSRCHSILCRIRIYILEQDPDPEWMTVC